VNRKCPPRNTTVQLSTCYTDAVLSNYSFPKFPNFLTIIIGRTIKMTEQANRKSMAAYTLRHNLVPLNLYLSSEISYPQNFHVLNSHGYSRQRFVTLTYSYVLWFIQFTEAILQGVFHKHNFQRCTIGYLSNSLASWLVLLLQCCAFWAKCTTLIFTITLENVGWFSSTITFRDEFGKWQA